MQQQKQRCVTAFNERIRSKPFEQFSLLLCDLDLCSDLQRRLLQNVLFCDEFTPMVWLEYINCVLSSFSDRKMQIQRLVNKAIECLDEEKFRQNKQYLSLHQISSSLKSDSGEVLKYYENTIGKKKIGSRFAVLYISWAKAALNAGKSKANTCDILRMGIKLNAEPQHSLIAFLLDLQSQLENDTKTQALTNTNVDCSEILAEAESGHEGNKPLSNGQRSILPMETQAKVETHMSSTQENKGISPIESLQVPEKSLNVLEGSFNSSSHSTANANANLVSNSNVDATIKLSESTPITPNIENGIKTDSPNGNPNIDAGDSIFEVESICVFNKKFIKLGLLGKGGSATVFRLLQPKTGCLYAFKRMMAKDHWSTYENEVKLLQKLKGNAHVVELIDSDLDKANNTISILMELGDIDLASVLSQRQRHDNKNVGVCAEKTLNPFFPRMVWHEMLEAVGFVHSNRIVHGDLKPANFIFVKGRIKLIDFGIAKEIPENANVISRDCQIGTINYMAPEALTPSFREKEQDKVIYLGTSSDVWSLGCILFQIVFGHPPFSHLNTVEKLKAIPNPKYVISYPSTNETDAVESMQLCLQRNSEERVKIGGSNGLLTRNYLRTYQGVSHTQLQAIPHQSQKENATVKAPRVPLRVITNMV